MRIILITHTDLDGAACILAFKELYKDYPGQLEYYCCNPDKSDKTFEKVINKYPLEIHKVIFADMCIRDVNTLSLISKYNITVEIYDHHISAENFMRSHKLPDNLSCVFTTNEKCGALNFYENNIDGIKPDNKDLETFLMYVNDHDLFIRKYRASDDYNIYFNAIGMDRFISRGYCTLTDSELYAVEILKLKEQKYIADAIKHMNYIDFAGKNLAVVVSDDCPISMLAETMRCEEIDCDGLMVINMNSGLVSLRSIRDNFSCVKFAKQMSKIGGRHEKAAGFSFNQAVYGKVILGMLSKQLNFR